MVFRLACLLRSRLRLLRIAAPVALLAAVVAILLCSGVAVGYFGGLLSGGSSAVTAAGSLPQGATPSVSVAGNSVTVSWTQTTVGGQVLGSYGGGGYTVQRYASTGGSVITPGSSCNGTISGATATLSCTEANVPPGNWYYEITPVLNSWSGPQSSASETATTGVATDTVTASANPASVGTAVTYRATISGGGATPTGSVTFKDGGTAIGTCGTTGTVTLSGGVATCTVTYAAAGSHNITAAYSGDSNYSSAAGNTVSETVSPGTATDTVSSSSNPSYMGAQVTYTATVTGAGAGPTGAVTFKDGGTAISTCGTSGAVTLSGGVATCQVTYAAAGSHAVTAAYGGDSNYNPAAGNTVNQTVSLRTATDSVSSSPNPTTIGSQVTYTATVTGSAGTPTGSVSFQDGGTPISTCGTSGTVTLSGGVATCQVTYAASGSHSITAAYSGDGNYGSAAGNTVTQVVKTNSATSVAANYNPVAVNAQVTYTATVTGSGGTPTGNVTFQDGGTAISGCGTGGAVALSAGVATCTVSYSALGSHSITAVYGGDGNFASSTSSSLAEAVQGDSNSLTQSAPTSHGNSGKAIFSGTATDPNPVTVYYCLGTVSSCSSATAAGSVAVTPSGSGSPYTWTSATVNLSKSTAYTSQAYQIDPFGLVLSSAAQPFTT